jgi:hypothetical protein
VVGPCETTGSPDAKSTGATDDCERDTTGCPELKSTETSRENMEAGEGVMFCRDRGVDVIDCACESNDCSNASHEDIGD